MTEGNAHPDQTECGQATPTLTSVVMTACCTIAFSSEMCHGPRSTSCEGGAGGGRKLYTSSCRHVCVKAALATTRLAMKSSTASRTVCGSKVSGLDVPSNPDC